jgi:hypothetical protein
VRIPSNLVITAFDAGNPLFPTFGISHTTPPSAATGYGSILDASIF